MNINRDYLIINDVKKSNIKLDNGSMFFYITDKNTQNIFVNLVINVSNNDLIQKYANIENAEDYTLTMNIVKPDNTYKVVEGKLHDKEKAIFEFNLNEDCCNEIGTYRCELLTKCNINNHEEITTSNKLTYKVKSSVLNDLDDIVEAPEYPLVIQLFDKLSDINQYEEDRRANELARQLAEEQRQTRFNTLDADMVHSMQTMDDKVVDVENRISAKEDAVDTLIADTKADIDEYKTTKDQEINDYKAAKDTEINNAITAQDNKISEAITNQNNKIDNAIANQNNKIDTAVAEQNNRIEIVEASDNTQNTRLDALEAKDIAHETSITNIEAKNVEQDNRLDVAENRLDNIGEDIRNTIQPTIDAQNSRLDSIEAIDVAQNTRLDAIEIKNQQQDDRLLDVEKVNNKQDIDIKCLYGASQTIDVTKEGNSIYLQNSNNGFVIIDEIQGNTMVNCNKEPNKEIILNGNINTQGYSNITLNKGVDGGLVDVALEGNTMVNVCDPKDPVAITKSYTVETGNHVALQGEYDGKCRPVVTGNTLWIDNATEEVLTAFDDTKNLRLQSSFEDKVVTQEMVDAGEELAENLGKYKVNYVVTGKNKFKFIIPKNINNITSTKLTITNNEYLFEKTEDFTNSGNQMQIYYEGNLKNKIFKYSDIKCYTRGQWVVPTETHLRNDYLQIVYNWQPIDKVKITDLMLVEREVTDLTYEPYKEYKKTFYLNSPLLEGDTIEQQGDNVVHVHRSELRAYQTDDELTLPTDMTNTLVAKATPQYEVISENDTILCDSYVNGHLDIDSVVPIEKVDFLHFEEELTYLYVNTQYAVQFVSNAVSKVDITLGGAKLLNQNVVVGTNKYMITTPSELIDNNLALNGEGFNASNIVVTEATDQDFGYFEGMKSVGECEDLEVVSSNSDSTLSNAQTLTHEPLRAVGDAKDKYVLIDGKWYIERSCGYRNNYSICDAWSNENLTNRRLKLFKLDNSIEEFDDMNALRKVKSNKFKCVQYGYMDGRFNVPFLAYITENGNLWVSADINYTQQDMLNYIKDCQFVYELPSPTYEPIDYNPLEVYSDITHISNNSTIPCNMTIKNTGYNCLLKPSTTYTVSSNLGLNTVTTPSVLTEDCLRFYDTDINTVTTMKNVMVLEGDYTTGKPLPSHFSGIESAFEQEYDEVVGKYKVKIRVQNEDASKENYIEFYINEPLRGIGDTKDKVYVKNDKVVVERNCGQREYQDGDFGTYLTDKVNTVYQLAEPTYEEVEYNDVKLFIESFKNSTLFYNSNIPVTSTVHYSYSVPLVDTVAQTANVTDQQDQLIIDLATQCAVMEMMLM